MALSGRAAAIAPSMSKAMRAASIAASASNVSTEEDEVAAAEASAGKGPVPGTDTAAVKTGAVGGGCAGAADSAGAGAGLLKKERMSEVCLLIASVSSTSTPHHSQAPLSHSTSNIFLLRADPVGSHEFT